MNIKMDYADWEEMVYTTTPIEYQPFENIRIFGYITMIKDIYAFGINTCDTNLYVLSMTSPECIASFNNNPITKDIIDKIMSIIDNFWFDIIDSIKKCIESDSLTEDYVSIDLSKIPNSPPDYRKILE